MYEQISELCWLNRITVAELCRRINIPQSTMSNAKKRGRPLGVEYLLRIAKCFGVTVEYLMGVEEEKANA